MSQKLHEKIRHAIETTPGLTQRGLAERMGLNPAAVNRMLYGRRNIMASEVPLIESYLGVRLDVGAGFATPDAATLKQARLGRGFSDRPHTPFYNDDASAALPLVPVLQGLRGSAVIDRVARHPLQAGIEGAYALYVQGDEMAPRYYSGELVYVHPGKPVEAGRDCVIETRAGAAVICRLSAIDAQGYHALFFNPAGARVFARADVAHVFAIVGRG